MWAIYGGVTVVGRWTNVDKIAADIIAAKYTSTVANNSETSKHLTISRPVLHVPFILKYLRVFSQPIFFEKVGEFLADKG